MRVSHVSDTHGSFQKLGARTSLVIHSGDFFPNKTRGIVSEEKVFQLSWLKDNLETIKSWLDGRIMIFCSGNHDYLGPELTETLVNAGMNFHDITNAQKEIAGYTWYGFPYVPFIEGEWNYERRVSEMSTLVEEIPNSDMLVAHCPPWGILSDELGGKDGGNTSLTNLLTYGDRRLGYLFCGHFHESYGVAKFGDMVISNAATRVNVFDI